MGKTKSKAKKIPIMLILAGAFICGLLALKSLAVSSGSFDYYRHVLSVQIYQAIMFISIECGIGAVWFEYLRIKTEEMSG